MPLVLGIASGVALMFVAMALGLQALLAAAPALHAVLLIAVGTTLVSLWALAGAALRAPLARPGFARGFNAAMAALLVTATLPVLLG